MDSLQILHFVFIYTPKQTIGLGPLYSVTLQTNKIIFSLYLIYFLILNIIMEYVFTVCVGFKKSFSLYSRNNFAMVFPF